MRTTATITAVLCVAAALALAFLTYWDVSMAGFPDGHVTDYGKAVAAPLRIVTWTAVGLAGVALVLAFSRVGRRARLIGLCAVAAAVVVVALVAWIGVPWYFGTHLGLDNGTGG